MIAIVLFVVAGVFHLLAAFNVPSSVSWSELAWACFTFAVAVSFYGR